MSDSFRRDFGNQSKKRQVSWILINSRIYGSGLGRLSLPIHFFTRRMVAVCFSPVFV